MILSYCLTVKPYYQDTNATIYHGDCREIIPRLPKADLLLTDPPYGIGVATNNAQKMRGCRLSPNCPSIDYPKVFGDDVPFNPDHLLNFDNAVLWGANNYADRLPVSPCWFVWDRKDGTGAKCSVTDCELAWVRGLPFKTVRLFSHMWVGFRRDSEVGMRSLHPTQKPVVLMSWCLSFFPKCRTVIDPYCGTGPVLRAAKDGGRSVIGIEIEEIYCECAAKRMQQQNLFPFGIESTP